MDKIDISKIRGQWIDHGNDTSSGGDDTVESIKMVAEKVNELVNALNNIEKHP